MKLIRYREIGIFLENITFKLIKWIKKIVLMLLVFLHKWKKNKYIYTKCISDIKQSIVCFKILQMTYALSSHTDTDRIDLEDCQLNIPQQNQFFPIKAKRKKLIK